MLTVAVTGGAGSGKTLVCECFGRLGAEVINLDDLAREAVQLGSPVLKAIVDHFGKAILNPDGSLNRAELRGVITRDPQARQLLERLTHPEILRLFQEKVATIKSRQADAVVVVEVPLLIEVGIQDTFDVVVLVEAGLDLQERRLVDREGMSPDEARALIGIQMSVEEKRPHADYIVKNQSTVADTEAVVQRLYSEIKKGVEKG